MPDQEGAFAQWLKSARAAAQQAGIRVRPVAKIAAGVLALLVSVAIVAGPLTLASPPSCGVCHVPAVALAQMSSSPHASVRCEKCHSDRAALGALGNSAALVSDLLRSTGGQVSDRSWVPDDACVSCHPLAQLDKAVVNRPSGLRMSHAGLGAAGYRCVDCHASVAHKVPSARISSPTMSLCAGCHNNVRASGKCAVCHTDAGSVPQARQADPVWSKTHGPNWRQLHGMGDLTTCTICHQPSECEKCHGIALPHDDAFLATHGATAQSTPQRCVTCHMRSFCDGCHGIQMPHPPGFLSEHPSIAGLPGAPCMRCHVQANCDECHIEHVHPGGVK